METNQLDDVSLRAALKAVEEGDDGKLPPYPFDPPLPPLMMPEPVIWSDATYQMTQDDLAKLARTLIAPVEAAGLLSAGYLEVRGGTRLWIANGAPRFSRYTQAQCSLTVRDPQGKDTKVALSRVTAQVPSKKSLMPDGLLQPLSPTQVRDLMGYLMSD